MVARKKSISIIEHSDMEGILEISVKNWNGKIFKIPRIAINKHEINELNNIGVYFLIFEVDNNLNSIYVGESENLKNRLLQHITDYNTSKRNEYWSYTIIFIGEDLDKASLRYMETYFYNLIKGTSKYNLTTKTVTSDPKLSNFNKISCNDYINTSLIVLKILGIKLTGEVMEINEKNKKMKFYICITLEQLAEVMKVLMVL